jgi:hypothetical protein
LDNCRGGGGFQHGDILNRPAALMIAKSDRFLNLNRQKDGFFI